MIHLHIGPMWAGKTSALIRAAQKYRERGPVWVLKPAIDVRYRSQKVASHGGAELSATVIDGPEHLQEMVNLVAGGAIALLIDEIQFFSPEVAHVIEEVAGDDLHVHCYGLNMDCFDSPFETTTAVADVATEVTTYVAVCGCGRPAEYTRRFDADGIMVTEGDVVQVGGAEMYKAMCVTCAQNGKRDVSGS